MGSIFEGVAFSSVGLLRDNNEDNLFFDGEIISIKDSEASYKNEKRCKKNCIFAICDGMGGESDGEIASLKAVSELQKYSFFIKNSSTENIMKMFVNKYISSANKKICSETEKTKKRMGTTLALMILRNGKVYCYNIGDSRIYLFRNNELKCLSKDHTIAQQKVDLGFISPEKARNDPDKHQLTQHLGISPEEMLIEAHTVFLNETTEDDIFLICSDGLTDMLDDEHIKNILSSENDLSRMSEDLLNGALENGGKDNVSAILVRKK